MAELKAIQNYLNSFAREVIAEAKENLQNSGKGGGEFRKIFKV
jgi:hypothetical protein